VPTQDVIVIGGSAGALADLRELLHGRPAGFPAAIFVVIHTSADRPRLLPALLAKAGRLPADYARDGDSIRFGKVTVAPPDHHLILKPAHVRVTRGPRENRFRPAIDPLFRTAAAASGRRVIGVILSGGQDDGVIGLAHIKRAGGNSARLTFTLYVPGMRGALWELRDGEMIRFHCHVGHGFNVFRAHGTMQGNGSSWAWS